MSSYILLLFSFVNLESFVLLELHDPISVSFKSSFFRQYLLINLGFWLGSLFHFKTSGTQWPDKTIYLTSDGLSLTNNITFAFHFSNNNLLLSNSFLIKQHDFYLQFISKSIMSLHICNVFLYSSKIKIIFFLRWVKFLWLVSDPYTVSNGVLLIFFPIYSLLYLKVWKPTFL